MCTQNLMTILDSTTNIIGGDLYDHLMSTRIFTFITTKILKRDSKNYKENDYDINLICYYPSSKNHMFHILAKVGSLGKIKQKQNKYTTF